MNKTSTLRTACALCVLALSACNASQSDTATTPSTATMPAAETTSPAETMPPAASMAADDPSAVAVDRPQSHTTGNLTVSSSDVQAQTAIPLRFTDYGDSISPALAWTPVDGAQSYALLLEDPDANLPQPFVHWVAWNIPTDVTHLSIDLAKAAQPPQPDGMHQGFNGKQRTGYFGPRPPAGDAPHHYHFEVFALDNMPHLPNDADRDALVSAIDSHVIAKGELVATSQAPGSAK